MNTTRQSEKKPFPYVFWFFIVISIPLVILVVGYAAGYRFNVQTKSLYATSALAVKTSPKGAVVSVNGAAQEQRTPFIQTLLPGTYTITVSKDGYFPWEKTVHFETGRSLIFPDVVLFTQDTTVKSAEPRTPSNQSAPASLTEAMKEKYRSRGWQYVDELWFIAGPWDVLIDTHQNASYVVSSLDNFLDNKRIDAAARTIVWLNEKEFLFTTQYELWVYSIESNTSTLLTRQSKPILDAIWHTDGEYIIFSDESGVYAIEMDGRDRRQTWALATAVSPLHLNLNTKGTLLFFESNGTWWSRSLEAE